MENCRFKMLPSKPRLLAGCGSGSPDVVKNSISASKYRFILSKSIRGKPSKAAKLPEKGIVEASKMEQRMDHLQEELKAAKERLSATEEERDRALDELREMKKVADEANMTLSEALPSRKAGEIYMELNAVKKSLSDASQELRIKEKNIESLKLELEKARQLGLKLSDKDASSDKLKEESNDAKSSETCTVGLLSEYKKRIRELEVEIGKGKESEAKMFNSFVTQTKQLEETKIALEESKLEITSLHEKLERLEGEQSSRSPNASHSVNSVKEALESLRSELQLTKENLTHAQEGEKLASLKAQSLLEEMGFLKNELRSAIEAEEKSNKAMDDLALALKEVAMEANQVKEKLSIAQVELEHAKGEADQSKVLLNSSEGKYQELLNETNTESERLKNTVERLRVEAEESLLAWNEKEIGFVSCIKRAEEERTAAQQEYNRLLESIKASENKTMSSREENHKLRDILKQALNEATAAKEAAGIATAENSQLKDCLAEKDNALDILTRHNESLRINEAAALENVKELKRLLSTSSARELRTNNEEFGGIFRMHNPALKVHKGDKKLNKAFSFDLKDLRVPNRNKDVNEDPKKADALKGSIFDTVESPKSETHHRKGSSSTFTDDGETINSDDYDHLSGTYADDMENDRNSQRKKVALLRRFGNLIRRGSFHKKEPSME
ncbi:putative WEB family protein At1g65010, chloroplastic isoform X2 [Malania oleifera]|nr:putative WEB family protein At1g65010, chloroplastic isoform X2 [Malania oleifera]